MRKNIAYGLGILLIALLLYLSLFTESQVQVAGVKPGSKAPEFTLKTLKGEEISLRDLRGKVVLLNFWATWCPPCKEEMPLFVEVYRKYREKGFEILAVSMDSKPEPVEKFVREYRFPFPVLMDDGNVSTKYGVQGLPTSFLIDRDGEVVKVRLGKYKEIEEDLKDVL